LLSWNNGANIRRTVQPIEYKSGILFLPVLDPKNKEEDIDDELADMRDKHVNLNEKVELIANHFALAPGKNKMVYSYDFGLDWDHAVLLEKILPAVEGQKYPICLAGKLNRLTDNHEFKQRL